MIKLLQLVSHEEKLTELGIAQPGEGSSGRDFISGYKFLTGVNS